MHGSNVDKGGVVKEIYVHPSQNNYNFITTTTFFRVCVSISKAFNKSKCKSHLVWFFQNVICDNMRLFRKVEYIIASIARRIHF